MSGASPRRRQSPAVYRRRRLVMLVAVLAIVGIVWLLIAQPWRGSASEGEGATPQTTKTQDAATELPAPPETDPADSASSSPSASPSATTGTTNETPPAAPACAARDIAVEAVTDQDTYGSGQNPQLSIRLTNNGTADCTMNVGTATQVFTITSGSDTWWRSTDCQSEPSDMVVLLAAGQTVSSAAPLVWDRTRSAVGTCAADANRPKAPGGGASYHLAVEIGGIPSAQTRQLLLY